MSTKAFYDRNAEELAETLDLARAGAEVRRPGNRYFCVLDYLSDPGRLHAVELGFGTVSRAALFSSLFAGFEAADISATRLLGGQSVGFSYRDIDLDRDWPYGDGTLDVVIALLAGRMPVTSLPDWFAKRQWDGGHLHYFTIALVRRIAALNGLRVVRLYPVGRFAGLKRLWPGLLCHEISYVLEKA